MFKEKKKYCDWKKGEKLSFLEDLFLRYPEKDWKHFHLAMNPNISLDFIEKYLKEDDLKFSGMNPNITREFIEKHPVVIPYLDHNISLTLEDYMFIGDMFGDIYFGNIGIFYKLIKHDKHGKYDLKSPNIFWKIVIDNIRENWDWNILWKHPLEWDIVKDIPKKYLRISQLTYHPNITWEIIKNNPDKHWQWDWMSHNHNITWEIIMDNLDKPWEWFVLSANPNITWESVREDLYENLEYAEDEASDSGYDSDFGFGEHTTVREKVENKYTGKWCFSGLTENPNITFDIIESNPDLPWDMSWFSYNPNLDNDSMKYIDKYDFGNISHNKFLYHDTVHKREKSKDIKCRHLYFQNIFEKISPFSRNIDRIIRKRLSYF